MCQKDTCEAAFYVIISLIMDAERNTVLRIDANK